MRVDVEPAAESVVEEQGVADGGGAVRHGRMGWAAHPGPRTADPGVSVNAWWRARAFRCGPATAMCLVPSAQRPSTYPASTCRVVPVTNEDRSEISHSEAWAISVGWPKRFSSDSCGA